MPRYKRQRKLKNVSKRYRFLRRSRDLRSIIHYDVQELKNPTIAERTKTATVSHIWSYGDRYYNLAAQYYGVPDYWWVIAWWNGRPCEANIKPGDKIVIPLNLEEVLIILRAN
tara:strand:+ start:247 stop:585 length:339 start_codon:yes stop_codon:yes gene_type:complete